MKDKKSDETGRLDSHQGENSARSVRWDETNARTIFPTICTISATPQEFVLLFGKQDSLDRHGQRQIVRDAEKITVNPRLAKWLADALNEALRQYELRFGPLEPAPAKKEGLRAQPNFPALLSPLPADPVDKRRQLLDLVTGLNASTALEHSFKIRKGQLSDNRFLLCVNRVGQGRSFDEGVKKVCDALGMPPDYIQEFARHLPEANYIYFGFEEDGARSLYKAYLEFRDRAEEKIKEGTAGPGPLLLHLGFKWDTSNTDRKALTQYEWHHSLDFPEIFQRLPMMLPRQPGHDPLSVAEAIIGLASERVEAGKVQYLEVSEQGNPRKSFDINLYKSGNRLEEFKPFLLKLADCYDLDQQEFVIFCDQIASKRFGHLAGGTDREGRDFVTVYYGVEYLPPAGG